MYAPHDRPYAGVIRGTTYRSRAVPSPTSTPTPAGVTVAAIAAAWGFTPKARFAHHYRRQCGTLPGHTLRT
ncbi:hypothetical protein [Lentzea sp. CA-135723]|uniref:hypothetical protein n=1 Tax=Lentzea sp. CA-135723 TaxID=3239950 RepID=UPI003D934C8B